MTLRFGVFDHIEPVPGQRLDQIYRERLIQIERLDQVGFYAYHLAERHTTAIRRDGSVLLGPGGRPRDQLRRSRSGESLRQC